MAVAIDKQMKERAKTDGKPLIQISMDCRHLTDAQIAALPVEPMTKGYVAMSGPASVELANAIIQLWLDRAEKGEV